MTASLLARLGGFKSKEGYIENWDARNSSRPEHEVEDIYGGGAGDPDLGGGAGGSGGSGGAIGSGGDPGGGPGGGSSGGGSGGGGENGGVRRGLQIKREQVQEAAQLGSGLVDHATAQVDSGDGQDV